ncbi:MAG: GWxTD domain-containing protein [Candidatus Zhuqueibacterota bacterium]
MHFKLVDRNSGNEFELKNNVVVKSFPEKELSLSDIEVASSVDRSDEETNFVKNGRKVLANPSRQFETGSEDVHVYFEIYNLNTAESNGANTFRFEYEVKNSAEEVVRAYYQSYPKPYSSTSIDFAIPTKKLEPDAYSLAVTIIDEDTRARAMAVAMFSVTRSPLDGDPTDFDRTIAMLQLIGAKSEIAEMKKASELERRALLTKFWRGKDPTPGTPENELMIEFYNRIDYANAHYSTDHVEGWNTDRGKIFIKHGKPDRITRSVPMAGWIRYETWEYWNKGRTFMFGDRFGFGNYTMIDWLIY